MGPMGASENNGPQRAKHAQENPSLKRELDDNQLSSKGRYRNHITNDVEDEQDELDDDDDGDENMEDHEDQSDQDNVDELMDEEASGEFNGSRGQAYYSRQQQQQQQQQQFISHNSRSLQNILPRPGTDLSQSDHGYGHDGISHERGGSDPAMSSWDPHGPQDLSRQDAPYNNRPLQARSMENNDMNGTSDYYNKNGVNNNVNNNNNNNSSNNVNHIKNGASAGHGTEGPTGGSAAGSSSTSSTNIVNNGSSKKRTTPAKHKCPQCDKYFTRPFNLKSHQRTHTQERPFVCSFAHCARAFSRLHDCNRHMRTHWRIKPYSCPECHRNFVRQDALTRHLRLDFGHNRCSGYPGPLPGASAQDKSEDSADDAMGDSSTEASSHHSASKNAEGGNATVQPGPSFNSPSSTSPTLASPTGQGHSRLESSDIDRDNRMGKSASNPDVAHSTHELREDGRDIGSHSRHPSSNIPINFVHRNSPTEPTRASITPPIPNEKLPLLPQHSRSFSHSSFGQPPTPTSATGVMPPQSFSGSGRVSPINTRNGSSWIAQGHDLSNSPVDYHQQSHHQGHPSVRQLPPPHVLTRPEALKSVNYGNEFDRMRTYPHPQSDQPLSPQEARRSSPPNHPSEWNAPGQDNARPWGWDSRHHEARHRHPSWGSAPSPTNRGPPPPHSPHDQVPQSPLSRGSNVSSWQRGPPPPLSSLAREEPSRESRDGPIRVPPRPHSAYPSSPYPLESSAENHSSRPPNSAPQVMTRPIESYRRPDLERDPRQRSMTEIDRIRGQSGSWSEQRSRSFHEMDTGVDSRSRFDPRPHSPQHIRDNIPVGRPPVVEAPSSAPERSHIYSGMVGAERYPPVNSYHERDPARENGAVLAKSSMTKDPSPRDYRPPARSQSTMEYDSNRDAYHRQPRYSGESKTSIREARRSMSPISSERFSNTDAGRSYDGGPRYPYVGDRPEQYNREEAEKMAGRQFRHDERVMVMSPLPRDDQGGYYGEPGRPNSYRSSQSYPQPQQRPQELPHRHLDEQHESIRHERHSMDMSLASSSSAVGPPAPKRLAVATVATR
ncbi:hypothetical protein BGZ49_010453 [Haplosporangium sp. Z 27]|nr:hypothetical protein BGZ49_010453 [Haplosporangium sp. Z 27]